MVSRYIVFGNHTAFYLIDRADVECGDTVHDGLYHPAVAVIGEGGARAGKRQGGRRVGNGRGGRVGGGRVGPPGVKVLVTVGVWVMVGVLVMVAVMVLVGVGVTTSLSTST